MATPSTHNKWLPTLRDPTGGWKSIAVLFYSLVANGLGFLWMTQRGGTSTALLQVFAVLLAAHGRIVASYMVHDATHSAIFVEPSASHWVGVLCLWLAGCPYADFDHVKKMHIAHHKDRADTSEFDYRKFVTQQHAAFRSLVLACEWALIPAIEVSESRSLS